MSDATNCAGFDDQFIELLPARIVLSLFTADGFGNGEAGKAGANGQSEHGFTFFGMFGWNGSNPTTSITDSSGQA
jgi:hypothetical protein